MYFSTNELKKPLIAIFYGTCSISMTFLNKDVISSFKFNFPFLILSIQVSSFDFILKLFIFRYK